MDKNEKIDVLIPAWNVEKYIEKCLNSLVSQTYKNLNIIIVDDGSTDSTASIIKTFQNKYPNITLYEKENEKSISKTRNFLLSKIKSKYFSFFDSDDFCAPTYFEELYNNMINNDADISICTSKRAKDKPVNWNKLNKHATSPVIFNQDEAIAEMLSANKYAGTCPMKLMKTELSKDLYFDANIHYGEDLYFCYQYLKRCKKAVYTSKKLYYYVIRKNSIVNSKFNTKKVSCLDCYQNIIDAEQNNPMTLTAAKSMQGLIAIELLYYTFRDKYKDKLLKKRLKLTIKNSIFYIKQNKRLRKLYRCTPLVWWLTKFM